MFTDRLKNYIKSVDWFLLVPVFIIVLAGIVTMGSFSANDGSNSTLSTDVFFNRQLIWLLVSVCVFFIASFIDWSFLKNTTVIVILFSLSVLVLLLLFAYGSVVNGARSWFNFGAFSFQPTDFAKLAVILILSKYFSRRHIEIANVRHILVSAFYVSIVFFLIILQPDLGSAVIISLLWLGMVLVSGISKKHLVAVVLIAVLFFGGLWSFAFKPYQKERIKTFISPLTDIRGSGYNAYQSMIAVGSGGFLGKGVGYGTQSRLRFLPEYRTDFIFAAFAEEWGFVGVMLLFILYGLMFWRVLKISFRGGSNFEMLFGLGLAMFFLSHVGINVGMNIGLLPVTGVTLPFMSYGGSHLLAEFLGLGMLAGMSRYFRAVHKGTASNEMVGV